VQQQQTNQGFPIIILLGAVVLGYLAIAPQLSAPLVQQPLEMRGELPPPEQAGVRELHFVTSPANCRRMADRFQKMGRNIRLVRVMPNPYGSGGFQLRFICVFEGPDSQPGFFSGDQRYDGTGGGDPWQAP
jgi:hypothetical protein